MATTKSVREKTGNLEICQNTGNLFAQVVNSLIPKVKDIAIFAAKISIFFQKLNRSASQCCVCNSHTLCELAKGKIVVGQGKHREFENTV